MNTIKAFIFDLDGVITDTAEYHFKAWKALGEELGIPFDKEFNEKLKGISRMESLERILEYGNKQNDYSEEEKVNLATKKNEQYKDLIKSITPNDILPGINKLLSDLKNNNIRIGLGSASKNAPAIVEALELNNYIEYIVDPSSVEKGKPAPDIFLAAAKHFGLEPCECIGVEDAEAGVDAIKSAGMFAVGVGEKESMRKADLIVEKTEDLDFKNIVEQFNKYISK